MPVHSVEDQPPVAGRGMPLHRGAVHLVSEEHGGKARTARGAHGAPARHHLAHVLFAPQAEREAVPPRRNAGDEAIAGGPFSELHARYGGIADGCLTKGGKGGRGGGGGREIGHAPPSLPPLPPVPPSALLANFAPTAPTRSAHLSQPRAVLPVVWIT